jgi:hypothetical protein
MAIGKQTICLMLWGALCAQAVEFSAAHRHLNGRCNGVLAVTEEGIAFRGPKGHNWKWPAAEIRQLQVAAGRIGLLDYSHSYEFTGQAPAAEIYAMLQPLMERRMVYEAATPGGVPQTLGSVPVERRLRRGGSGGTLAFGSDSVIFAALRGGESRTWRYADIDTISTSGPYQLTITTFELAPWHYGDRKEFNFRLKEPITEARYNELWLHIERKNGKLP